jgi:hypothetical protein
MTDSLSADELLAYLSQQAEKLRQPDAFSPKTEKDPDRPGIPPGFSENGDSPKIFYANFSPKRLKENDSWPFSTFLRGSGEDTHAHMRDERGRAGAHTRTYVYNNNYYGETEKERRDPRVSAEKSFSVADPKNGEFSEIPENGRTCCLCKQIIHTLIDTFWGPNPAHRQCAQAAFQTNKAAGRYRPRPKPRGARHLPTANR